MSKSAPNNQDRFDDSGWPSDQPSIIYSVADNDGERQIKELARRGSGDASTPVRRGDVLDRESTRSSLDDGLPAGDLPGDDEPGDDCGDEIPAFFCSECGKPTTVGRTCYSPGCDRCWPAAIKRRVTRVARKLEGLRRMLYVQSGERQHDLNHVVASPREFRVDSNRPVERALQILKTLLEANFNISGFLAVFHPYRIKDEYRDDQYDHGGAEGRGDMTWADVLSEDDPYQYLKHEPHFHLFFPAPRASFDYSVAEAVEDESGWLLHRITKSDSNVSVEDHEDLIHQLTYVFSHAQVGERADKRKFDARMKGELHNISPPGDMEDETLAAFSEAAPRLLGYSFSDTSSSSCDAEVAAEEAGEADDSGSTTAPTAVNGGASTSGGAGDSGGDDGPLGPDRDSLLRDDMSGVSGGPEPSEVPPPDVRSGDDPAASEVSSEMCNGSLLPMARAKSFLDDDDWLADAEYADALRDAYEEWLDLRDGDADLTSFGADSDPPDPPPEPPPD